MAATESSNVIHIDINAEPLFRPFADNDVIKKTGLGDCVNEDFLRLEEFTMPSHDGHSCQISSSQGLIIGSPHDSKTLRNEHINEKQVLMDCDNEVGLEEFTMPSYDMIHSQTHTQSSSDKVTGTQVAGKSLRNRQIAACTVPSTHSHAHRIVPGLLWKAWHKEEIYSLLSAAQKCCLLDKAWEDSNCKWSVVLNYMTRDGHHTRTDKTARGKFLVIAREFKYLKRWKVLGRQPAYESMTPCERRAHGLPRTFDDELYHKVQEFFDATGLDDGVDVVNGDESRMKREQKGGVALRQSMRLKNFAQASLNDEDTDGEDTDGEDSTDVADSDADDVDTEGADDGDGNMDKNVHVHDIGVGNDSCNGDGLCHHTDDAKSHVLQDKNYTKGCSIFDKILPNGSQIVKITAAEEKPPRLAKKTKFTPNAGPAVSDHSSPNGSQQTNITSEEKTEAKRRRVSGVGITKKMNDVILNHINATADHLAAYIQAVKMNMENMNLFLAKQL